MKKQLFLAYFSLVMSLFCTLLGFCSCTLSFSNVSTHGTAADVVDSDPSNEVRTSGTIPVSLSGI